MCETHELSSLSIDSYLLDRSAHVPIYLFDQVESTNDLAYGYLSNPAIDMVAVLAETQTSGRGRRGRAWTSPKGAGLLMSIGLSYESSPALHYEEWPLLASWALHRALTHVIHENVHIKWPNDIVLNEKKLAGILTELSSSANRRNLIIGFGINVNLRLEDLPEELRKKATSMFVETGQMYNRNKLAALIIDEIQQLRKHVSHGLRFSDIHEEWVAHCQTIGRHVRIVQGRDLIEGVASSIDHSGILTVIDDTGTHHRIASGEIIETSPLGQLSV